MLLFLVFLIVMILLFGASAVLSAAIGIVGWALGLVALLASVVWASTSLGIEPGLLIVALIVGVPLGLLAVAFVGYFLENQKRTAMQRQTFAEYWNERSGT